MTTEERFERIERNIDAASQILAGLAERQSGAEARQADTESKLNAFITSVHELEDDFRDRFKELITAQILMADQHKRTDEKLAELSADVKALVNVADGIIRNRPQS